MRVLVTRPLEDSQRTARALSERGHEAVVAPLFEINYLAGPEPPLAGVQAVLATSGSGVRGFARRTVRRDIPLFAVGARTAATAEQEGFCYIRDAESDAAALAALVHAELRPEAGALLHAAGTNASPVLSAALAKAGFDIRTCALYDTIEAEELPAAASDALRSNMLDAVLIYSPRSARLFADRVKRAGLASSCAGLLACCISPETAEASEGLSFAELRTAAHPNQDSLLALLPLPSRGR
jgi:uroporphyrinogen-III synthase